MNGPYAGISLGAQQGGMINATPRPTLTSVIQDAAGIESVASELLKHAVMLSDLLAGPIPRGVSTDLRRDQPTSEPVGNIAYLHGIGERVRNTLTQLSGELHRIGGAIDGAGGQPQYPA